MEADAVPVVRSRARYTLGALLFCVLWASGFVAIKVALRFAPPLLLMASRFLVAGVGILAVARLSGRPLPRRVSQWVPIAVLGLLNNALYLGVTAIALQHISAGMGAVLASTNPLLLALVAPWLLREPLTVRKMGGLVTSFAGVAAVMWSRLGDENRPGSMALFLVCVVFIVSGTILFKRMPVGHDLLVVNGGQLLAAGLALTVPSLLLESPASIHPTPALWLAQAYLIVVISGAAMLIWLWLLRHGDATRASAWFFLNPVLGLFMAAVALGEPLRGVDFLGAAAVALGIYVVQRT